MDHDAATPPDEFVLPCAEAMLAGTLALLTAHAQSACPQQRAFMACKIDANLRMLLAQAGLSPPFRTLLQRLQDAWARLAESGLDGARRALLDGLLPEQGLWHAPGGQVH